MNENENNFDALRQLLKLKQHETPPPGYFNNFSSQVIARIRACEAKSPASEVPWLFKFLQLFELKPAFAGAFASALLLLLVFGIVYAERPDSSSSPLLQGSEPPSGAFASLSSVALPQGMDSIGIMASNNPANSLQPIASLFGSGNAFVQPASFSPSGN